MKAASVSVIGAGGWGTALALLMARRTGGEAARIPLWGHDAAHLEEVRVARTNEKYLPGIGLPETIRPTSNMDDCVGADILLVAVPSKYLASVARTIALSCAMAGDRKPILVSCTKGIEKERGLLMSEVIGEQFPGATLAVLSGPNLAGEVAKGIPAACVIGCGEPGALPLVQGLFEGTSFRAYTSCDLRGIQLGGALKNVFAIGAGVSDGLGLGENAKAALVTRSLAEMTRLGVAMGGGRETFSGLGGIGDLMVTCFSSSSRNHQVGIRLGKGETLGEITASMAMVAEGVPTTASAHACARRLGVGTPVIDEVHAVLQGEKTPAQAIKTLMSRQLRSEEEI